MILKFIKDGAGAGRILLDQGHSITCMLWDRDLPASAAAPECSLAYIRKIRCMTCRQSRAVEIVVMMGWHDLQCT
jgi:hypothetical protein